MKKQYQKLSGVSCLAAGILLASVNIQADVPSLHYEINGKDFIITYTGILYSSSDAVIWTEVKSASSPYKVQTGNKKQFFCAKGESKNFTIPLSDTVDLNMIWIEPGTFIMGSPDGELGKYDDETQHEVTLTKGYWLAKYEVTQAQYEAVMNANPSSFKGADLPVEQVSWYDATNFCAKLTAIEKDAGRLPEGYEYTLPTEAQWEYACRAGTTTALNSGKNLSNKEECPEMDEVGWYAYNSGEKTHPVGQKLPNAWGLYDMHGNVEEWCLDGYKENYPSSPVVDPVGPATARYRVMRSGDSSWYGIAASCRSAYRNCDTPDDIAWYIGFRVALARVQ